MNVEKVYDNYWASGHYLAKTEWTEKQFSKWLGALDDCESVLDYGCGLGCAYQRRLSASAKNYTGADVSELALSDLRRKGFEAFKIDSENGTLKVLSNSFDGVVCSEVFEHLFEPLTAAREIYRVLKPGGVLVATVPNFGYHIYRLLAFLRAQVPSEPDDKVGNRYHGPHIRFFSKLMLKRMLSHAGFVGIKIGSFGESSVWDVFGAAGHLGIIPHLARKKLPSPFHLRFLEDVWPNVFAERLRAVACKPK